MDFAADAVAHEILGEGKTLTGRGRGEEILRLFHEDRERLVEYNRTDARLAPEILERLHPVALACTLGTDSYLPVYIRGARGGSTALAAFSVAFLTIGWSVAAYVSISCCMLVCRHFHPVSPTTTGRVSPIVTVAPDASRYS